MAVDDTTVGSTPSWWDGTACRRAYSPARSSATMPCGSTATPRRSGSIASCGGTATIRWSWTTSMDFRPIPPVCGCSRASAPHSQAVQDRGHLIAFEPPPQEVHRRTAEWFWDQQAFDFVADHLHLIDGLSMRDYHRAWELKRARVDWRRYWLERSLAVPTCHVARLRADRSFASEEDQVRAFVANGGGAARRISTTPASSPRPPSHCTSRSKPLRPRLGWTRMTPRCSTR